MLHITLVFANKFIHLLNMYALDINKTREEQQAIDKNEVDVKLPY